MPEQRRKPHPNTPTLKELADKTETLEVKLEEVASKVRWLEQHVREPCT